MQRKLIKIVLLISTFAITALAHGAEWPMFRHDSRNSARSPDKTIMPSLQKVWEYETGYYVESSPCVKNGTLYCGSHDHRVYALDAKTGEERWVFETGFGVSSSPAVKCGMVYIGSYDGNVYALHAETGEKIWEFTTEDWVTSSPTVKWGVVYIGSHDMRLYALRADTGEKLWEFKTGDWVDMTPAVVRGKVYIVSDKLYALNALSGDLLWTFESDIHWFRRTSPSVVKNTVYFGFDNMVYGINARTGRLKWKTLFPIGGGVNGELALGGSLLYVLGCRFLEGPEIWKGRLYALDTETGENMWEFTPEERESRINASPTFANGIVYFATLGGGIYAVHSKTGEKICKKNINTTINTSLVVADGMLYFGAMDFKIYACDTKGLKGEDL